MFKKMGKKGVALLVVLGMFLVAVILANVVLQIISSQPRLTHHQVSRIQAYYAAMAGINYALEMLRVGNDPNWPDTGTYSWTLCRAGCNINEPDLPLSINSVTITVGLPGSGTDGTREVRATTDYTYTP